MTAATEFREHLAARYPALTPGQLDALMEVTDRAAARLGRPATSPSVTLQRARQDAGLTQEQVSADMDWSGAKMSRVESDLVGISTNDLRALLAYYGIDDPETAEGLIEQARARRGRRHSSGRTATGAGTGRPA